MSHVGDMTHLHDGMLIVNLVSGPADGVFIRVQSRYSVTDLTHLRLAVHSVIET